MLLRYFERHGGEHGGMTKPDDAVKAFYITVYPLSLSLSLSPLVRHTSALVRGENGQTCFPDKETKNSPTLMFLWWH